MFKADIREAQGVSKQTLGRSRKVPSRDKGGSGRFQADLRVAKGRFQADTRKAQGGSKQT
jgi:hypothetical protein